MCQQLAEFRAATVTLAAAFDPALLSLADARMFVAGAAAIESSWAAMKALASARVAECGAPGPAGQRQATEELARSTGTTLGAARGTIELGRHLRTQPQVSAAARRGELSAWQTSAIAGAAAADPRAERRLVDTAAHTSLPELRDECARIQAAAVSDPDQRHADVRAGRQLRSWTDAGGVGHLHAHGNVEAIAQVMAAIEPIADRLFDHARRHRRRQPSAAYAFDALVELAVGATSPHPDPSHPDAGGPDAGGSGSDDAGATPGDTLSGEAATIDRGGGAGTGVGTRADPMTDAAGGSDRPDIETTGGRRERRGAPVKLQLRVDLDTWLRGFPMEGEMCELVGYGPVPVSVVRKLVAQGDPFVTAVLTKAQAVVGVAHLGRKPTAYQQSAVEWLFPSCAVRGCTTRAHLQVDHRTDWAKTHFTLLDLLDRLCIAHHNMKTRDGWALIDGIGKRPFVPPDDARHPRHSQNNPAARPPPPSN